VTNVEHDHPDYYPTPEDFYLAFRDFVYRLKPWGFLLACIDDEGARRLLTEARTIGCQVRSYGMNHWLNHDGPDYAGRKLVPNEFGGYSFEAVRLSGVRAPRILRVALQVPGRHNVSNALAALGVIDLLGLSLDEAALALNQYRGVGRRFEVRGEVNGITVIDDYAHHPSEIRATLAAARSRYRSRPLWAVWQPHTYSRSRALLHDFAMSFADAEHVIVTEVYAAREDPPEDGFSSRQIVEAFHHPDVQLAIELTQAVDLLVERLNPGDVVLVLSAGDADQISRSLLQRLGHRGEDFVEPSSPRSKKHV
jgi:UDP-N-acetylmuramate--alanine ligase